MTHHVAIIDNSLNSSNSKTGSDPVIIINLFTMAHQAMKQEVKDVIIGYRLNKIERDFEEFLQKLENAGAQMVFIFKKTQLVKDSDFITLKEAEYETSRDLILQIKTVNDFERIKSKYERAREQKTFYEFPFNQAVLFVLNQVALRYGKLHGMDSINNRPSTFQIHLANQYKAFAVIGLNTHYVFYDGDWAFWSDADLDMELMTVREYDRKVIMGAMGLTAEKAPLFATLAGSLYSDVNTVKQMVKFFQPWNKQQFFQNVSIFVNRQTFPISESSIVSIISQVLGTCQPRVLNEFKETLRLMDPVENLKVSRKVQPEIMELIKNDFANFAEELLENSVIFISPIYIDLR